PQLAGLDGKAGRAVGVGGIGTEVARRAHGFGMRVIATRASGRTGPDYVSYVGLPDELLKLAKEADFVVNCTPLTPQTTGIFNQKSTRLNSSHVKISYAVFCLKKKRTRESAPQPRKY